MYGSRYLLNNLTCVACIFKPFIDLFVGVAGNSCPFAVGTCEAGEEDISTGGMRGKAVSVMHMFGDELWRSGGSFAPNQGFGVSCIYAIENVASYSTSAAEVDTNSGRSSEDGGEVEGVVSCAEKAGGDAADQNEQDQAAVDMDDDGGGDDDAVDQVSAGLVEASLSSSGTKSSSDAMDIVLQEGLMIALKYLMKDAQLPMLASTFWSLISKCCQQPADIKKSRFKKVSVFLQYYQSLGLLTVSETNGVLSISRFERMHELYHGVKVSDPAALRLAANSSGGTSSQTEEQIMSSTSQGWVKLAGAPSSADGKIKVIPLFKFPKGARDLFGNARGEFGEYMRSSEVRDIVVMFVKGCTDGSCRECVEDKSRVEVSPVSAFGKFLWGI